MSYFPKYVIWWVIINIGIPLTCKAIHPLQASSKLVPSSLLTFSAAPTIPLPATSGSLSSLGQNVDQLNKIVGGHDASDGEIPWQVGLRQENIDHLFCGGTLVSSRVVVTAAHCFDDDNDFFVGMGGLKTSSFPITCHYDDIIIHEMYRPGAATPENDIALIILDKDVSFSTSVQPAALSWYDEDVNSTAIISGWGNIDNNGDIAKTLQLAEIQIWDQEECESAYQDVGNQITDEMICAGYYEYPRDACTGDSGGPLVVKKNSYDILIGITSWGPKYECAKDGFPGVYTRITSYFEWIHNTACSSGHCIPEIMTSTTTQLTTTKIDTTTSTETTVDSTTFTETTADTTTSTETTVGARNAYPQNVQICLGFAMLLGILQFIQ